MKLLFASFFSNLSLYFHQTRISFFDSSSESKYKNTKNFLVVILYGFGVYLWGNTFDWGRIPLDYFDWALINVPRIDFVRDALLIGTYPLHMLDIAPLHYVSDRFFTLPDVVTTPQMILLLFLSVEQFVLIDIIFHYTLGFLGLLWFYRHFNLSIFTLTLLTFLFGFNGYIFTHYAIGHFTWAGYFLFPLFFALVIRFLEGEDGWKWVTKMSFLLFYMVLAGSQHHYVWLLLFLCTLIITCWSRSKWLILVIVFSGFLSAIRLLPPSLELADYQTKGIFNDVFGYPSLAHLFSSMVFIQLPMESSLIYYPLNSFVENFWEFNFYIGIIGFCFVLYFGFFQWLKVSLPRWRQLIFPMFVLIILSIGSTFWIIRWTEIPLFGSERATMRMVSVPIVLLFLIASFFFQEWWNKYNFGVQHQALALMILALMLIDLQNNINAWRPSEIRESLGSVAMNITGNSIANHADPDYFLIIIIGFLLSLVSAIFLIGMSVYEAKKGRTNA